MAPVTRQEFIQAFIQSNGLTGIARIKSHGYNLKGKVRFAVPKLVKQGDTTHATDEWIMVTPEEYLERLEFGLPVDPIAASKPDREIP